MKVHWGYGILLVLLGFVGLMAYLTFQAHRIPSHLVRKDYYEASLNTDDHLAAERRGAMVPLIRVTCEADQLIIHHGKADIDWDMPLLLQLYCPSNPSLDWSWSGLPNQMANGRTLITAPRNCVKMPHHELHINWSKEGSHLYQQIRIE